MLLFYLIWANLPNLLALCPGDCFCDNTRLLVNCTDVYLQDLPITLNPHIKSMRINHAGLERLETNLQFYPNLILCDLSHNRLSTLTPYAFESQSQLNRLSVSNNRVATIYKESLHGLVNLQSLDLSHNKLTHLGANLFAQMNTLTDLDLSANSIGSIHRMAFEGLDDSLLGLNLEQNRLVSVPVDSLSPLSLLQSLSLAYNSLKRLEMSGPQRPSGESKLGSLIQLDLSFTKAERNNVCQILDLAPKLVQLIYLGNSANQLACIENNNIQELELGFTDILTSLDPAVFYSMSRLKKLSVKNAPELEVFAIDTLMANTRLEEVQIIDNPKLKTISLEVFSHLPSLQVLDLSNNSLRTLVPIEGSRFAQLTKLDISENPLDCNCTVRSLEVAGLPSNRIQCITHKDDLQADFYLTANSLFGDSTCLTPFTIKLVFLTSLILILGLLFTVSLTVQAFYVSRKRRGQEAQDANSLLISLPLVNKVTDFESPMMSAWHCHDMALSRSLDHLDLKDHRDLEEFTKRYYTNGHFASLKPTVSYVGKEQEMLDLPNELLMTERCDCVGHMHHQQPQYY